MSRGTLPIDPTAGARISGRPMLLLDSPNGGRYGRLVPTEPKSRKIMIGELIGEVIFILLGVLVILLGWTTFGETMVAIGAFGLLSWPVRVWRARRQRTAAPPTTN